MSESPGFIRQLIHRRVPQIVGAYIATLWLAVEIGGWVTEQFGWPSTYALYLFVGLAALLPSVVVLAWRHGAPGPDAWGGAEKSLVPINVLAAAALVVLVMQARPPQLEVVEVQAQAAVVERTLIDETGQEQVFQVAREGFGVSIISLFWPNEDEAAPTPAWESYAAPWLLATDLAKDPLISGGIAFDRTLIERLLAAGFENGLGEPLSLGLDIASDIAADYLIRGGFEESSGGYSLRAEVYAVDDGTLIQSFRQQGETLIAAADALSESVGELLVGDLDRGDAEFRPIKLAESTATDQAVLEPFTLGIKAILFDSDFERGIERLLHAVELDPSFAPGWAWLQQAYRESGDMASANEAIEQALAYDYKLETEMRFILRANQYAIAGDVDRAVRVLRMWTQVEPYSLRAWTALTRNLLLVGEVDEAREANSRAKTIDPDRPSLDRTLAEIEELAGNYELASRLLADYLEAEPQDDTAWISLGSVRERSGDIEGAREAYERASFVANNDFEARHRLMRLEARAGDPERAIRDFVRSLAQPLQPTEEARLALEMVGALSNLGRMTSLLDAIDTHQQAISQTLPPLARTLTLESIRAGAFTQIGQFEQALGLLDAASAQVPAPFNAMLERSRIDVYRNNGDLESATDSLATLRDFSENYEIPGLNVQTQLYAAVVRAMQDDHAGALQRLNEAQSMLSGTSMSLVSEFSEPMRLQRAQYQLASGDAAAAHDTLEELLTLYPNFGEARLLKARVQNELDLRDAALESLAGVVELWASADDDFLPLQQARDLAAEWGLAR